MPESAMFVVWVLFGGIVAWLWRGVQIGNRFSGTIAMLKARYEELEKRGAEWKEENERLRAEAASNIERISAADARIRELEKNLNLQSRQYEESKKSLLDSFKVLSADALQHNNALFLQHAKEILNAQLKSGEKDLARTKELVGRNIEGLNKNLTEIQKLVHDFEMDREKKFGELAKGIQHTAAQAEKMQLAALEISGILKDTRKRGEWGERMAEDVLNLAGFIEGINYYKQKHLEHSDGRPDYTFPLPHDLKVHMDVKFPLNHYIGFVNAENDADRTSHRKAFLNDVKQRIREVTTRDYIDPANNTVDYVILFIPNEQVYGFINMQSPEMIDDAMARKVILCSPLTLYAILSIIRQAVENFSLARTSKEIIALLGGFRKQWEAYLKECGKLGSSLEKAQESYALLMTTRRKKLDVQLRRVEAIQKDQHIESDIFTDKGGSGPERVAQDGR